jgi:hypothetical protein
MIQMMTLKRLTLNQRLESITITIKKIRRKLSSLMIFLMKLLDGDLTRMIAKIEVISLMATH